MGSRIPISSKWKDLLFFYLLSKTASTMSPVYQCSSPYDRTQNIVSYQLGSRPTNRTRHHRTIYYTYGLLLSVRTHGDIRYCSPPNRRHRLSTNLVYLQSSSLDSTLWFGLLSPELPTSQNSQVDKASGVCQLSPFLLSPFTMLISSFSEICSAGTALKGCVRKYNSSVRISQVYSSCISLYGYRYPCCTRSVILYVIAVNFR